MGWNIRLIFADGPLAPSWPVAREHENKYHKTSKHMNQSCFLTAVRIWCPSDFIHLSCRTDEAWIFFFFLRQYEWSHLGWNQEFQRYPLMISFGKVRICAIIRPAQVTTLCGKDLGQVSTQPMSSTRESDEQVGKMAKAPTHACGNTWHGALKSGRTVV